MRSYRDIRPNRVAIYIRWSTEDQAEGTTLATQQEGCQHYLLSQGWQVNPDLIFIDDGYSGGTLERPRLSRLRQYVLAGEIDCVVVYRLDRLSRSVMDTVNLILGEWEGRTFLKSAREPVDTTTAMGKQFFYMLVSYAEWERNMIRERTHAGKMRRASEGRSPGGPVPFGYRLSAQAGILEVDPTQAAVVQRIFRRYLDEVGTYRMADEMNREGIPSPTGGKWQVNTLLKMLRNPIYAGQIIYGRRTINPKRQRDKTAPWYIKNPEPVVAKSQFPPLISHEAFHQVQALLNRRHPAQSSAVALDGSYLLTGLLACGCGAPMSAHQSVRERGRVYAYYSCQSKKAHGKNGCRSGLVPQRIIHDVIESKLGELLSSPESYRHFLALRWAGIHEQLNETKERRRHVRDALQNVSDQIRRINHDYRSGALSAKLYEENRREMGAEAVQIKEQLDHLDRLERLLTSQLQQQSDIQQIFDLAKRWSQIPILQRKIVLRNLVEKVVAYKRSRAAEITIQVVWKFSPPTTADTR